MKHLSRISERLALAVSVDVSNEANTMASAMNIASNAIVSTDASFAGPSKTTPRLPTRALLHGVGQNGCSRNTNKGLAGP
jgi:hypothetical protein